MVWMVQWEKFRKNSLTRAAGSCILMFRKPNAAVAPEVIWEVSVKLFVGQTADESHVFKTPGKTPT